MERKLTEQQLIELVLDDSHQEYDIRSTIYSAFMTANENEFSNPLVSLLLYLIGMEQIGELFIEDKKKENGISYDNNGIVKVFRHFHPSINSRQLQAIKHLRHSLAHNYGLLCIDKDENNRCLNENKQRTKAGQKPQKLTGYYRYILDFKTTSDELIEVIETDTEFTDYKVYVSSLIKGIKNIYRKLKNLYYNGNLTFVRKEGQGNLSKEELNQIRQTYFAPTYAMDKQQFDSVPKLYHYTSFATALKILTSMRLKLSTAIDVNDITETDKKIYRSIVSNESSEETQLLVS